MDRAWAPCAFAAAAALGLGWVRARTQRAAQGAALDVRDSASLEEHYAHVGGKGEYEDSVLYGGSGLQERQAAAAVRALALQASDRFVDIGGGTGNFAALLRESVGLSQPVLVCDMSAPMLQLAAQREGLETRHADAVSLARSLPAKTFDKVLMKEMIHHVPSADLVACFSGLYAALRPGGRVLLMMRPKEVSWPMWPAALEVWREQSPHAEEFAEAMRASGFAVEIQRVAFPVELDREEWLHHVRNRLWSTFSHFSDEELEAGVAEIVRATEPRLQTNDEMAFVVGSKSEE